MLTALICLHTIIADIELALIQLEYFWKRTILILVKCRKLICANSAPTTFPIKAQVNGSDRKLLAIAEVLQCFFPPEYKPFVHPRSDVFFPSIESLDIKSRTRFLFVAEARINRRNRQHI